MKPYPRWVLNHFTVPIFIRVSFEKILIRCDWFGGGEKRSQPVWRVHVCASRLPDSTLGETSPGPCLYIACDWIIKIYLNNTLSDPIIKRKFRSYFPTTSRIFLVKFEIVPIFIRKILQLRCLD